MDDKEVLLYIKQAELQTEFILEAGQDLERSIGQLRDWSEDWNCQRRACQDIYDAVHLVLIHSHQLSRIFWPAKCCGEQGLDSCHRAIAIREAINLPDVEHPLRNEALWRHAEELDHSVRDNAAVRRYSAHRLTSFNQVITWMDNEAMFCWFEPATKIFVFHSEEFAISELLDSVLQLQKEIQSYLKKSQQPAINLETQGQNHFDKQLAN